jgi:1-acyl-sn-glycerol-3-phosphate acyltransferase
MILGGVAVFRSLVHLLFFIVVTILGALAAIVSVPFDRSGDTVLRLARLWSRVLLWTAGVDLKVRIEGTLDPGEPYVFVANHLSTVDIWALFVAIPRPIRFIAKKQLGQIPLFGWAMAAGRFIFIDRKNPAAARRSINLACHRIRGGSSVAIFPEGTRSRDGLLAPFKKGGFHLAVNAGVKVVPVAIRGAGDVMPPGSLLLRPGEVVVEIGQPIDVSAAKSADRDALIEQVRGEIQRRTGQASRPDRGSSPSTSPGAASVPPPGP